MYETRTFDPVRDSYYVVSHPSISPFPGMVTSSLRTLTTDAAGQLWKDVISRRGRPLTRFLPPSHWSNKFEAVGPNWMTNWNNWLSKGPTDSDLVRDFLEMTVSWDNTSPVCFILSGQSVLLMSWGLFLEYWPYFLHTDQTVLVVSPGKMQFVCFGETGLLGVGNRNHASNFDNSDSDQHMGDSFNPPVLLPPDAPTT